MIKLSITLKKISMIIPSSQAAEQKKNSRASTGEFNIKSTYNRESTRDRTLLTHGYRTVEDWEKKYLNCYKTYIFKNLLLHQGDVLLPINNGSDRNEKDQGKVFMLKGTKIHSIHRSLEPNCWGGRNQVNSL